MLILPILVLFLLGNGHTNETPAIVNLNEANTNQPSTSAQSEMVMPLDEAVESTNTANSNQNNNNNSINNNNIPIADGKC